MNKKLICILVIIYLGFFNILFAQQEQEIDFNDLIPPSPTASSLGKFVDMPVSYYTGLPNITIPIWVIEENGIKVPITLSYHASGIKVDDIPSWVGQNWTLNGGGAITRTVRGLPDESIHGYIHSPIPDSIDLSDPDIQQYLIDVVNGLKDAEPDIFFLNCNGLTGQLAFRKDSGFLFIPNQNIKVNISINYDNIDTWEITDGNGIRYIFGEYNGESAIEESKINSTCNNTAPRDNYIRNTWYLRAILFPNNEREISFHYKDYSLVYNLPSSETKYHSFNCGKTQQDYKCFSMTTVQGKYLSRIETNEGRKVYFDVDTTITELPKYRLKEIVIYRQDTTNASDEEIKNVYFYYSDYPNTQRFKIDSITEYSKGKRKPPYKFLYNSEHNVPSIFSDAQDIWGYYNGAEANNNLDNNAGSRVPKIRFDNEYYIQYPDGVTNFNPTINLPNTNKIYWEFDGADRDINSNYTATGILRKITYPTGGYILFEYEPNDYGFINHNKLKYYDFNPVSSGLLAPDNEETTTEFTIDYYQEVNISYTFNSNLDPAAVSNAAYVEITKWKGGVVFHRNYCNTPNCVQCPSGICSQSGDTVQMLDAGKYIIHFVPWSPMPDTNLYWVNARVTVNYNEISDTLNTQTAGGLRVKKILFHDNETNKDLITEYEYKYTDDTINGEDVRSSGVLMSDPLFYSYVIDDACAGIGGGDVYYRIGYDEYQNYPLNCIHLAMSSTNNAALGYTQGSSVGYRTVKVIHGENGENGYSIYKYKTAYDYPDNPHNFSKITNDYPFPPRENYDWKRGVMTETSDFTANNSLQKKETLIYNDHGYGFGEPPNPESDDPTFQYIKGLKVVHYCTSTCSDEPCEAYQVDYKYYNVVTGWNFLKEKITYQYNSTPTIINDTTQYEYNSSNLQISTTKNWQSRSSILYKRYYYPIDFTEATLDSKKETVKAIAKLKDLHINTVILEKQDLIQKNEASLKIISGKITTYKLFNTNQVFPYKIYRFETDTPRVVFKTWADTYAEGYNFDNHYHLAGTYELYDNDGNILQVKPENGPVISYKWGYNNRYPVAKVINTKNSNITGTYPNFAWPDSAQGKIFKYEIPFGIKEVIDENGRSTYYEYDSFGRLITIRDQDGKILKLYTYHYKDQ